MAVIDRIGTSLCPLAICWYSNDNRGISCNAQSMQEDVLSPHFGQGAGSRHQGISLTAVKELMRGSPKRFISLGEVELFVDFQR